MQVIKKLMVIALIMSMQSNAQDQSVSEIPAQELVDGETSDIMAKSVSMTENMMMPMDSEMMLNQCPMSEMSMEWKEADIEAVLNSMVVLLDIDLRKKMFVLDVDFYNDDQCDIKELLMKYLNNPMQAEMMLTQVAEKYMNESGDSVVYSLLKSFKVTDAESLTRIVRPFIQKTLMNELLRAMHYCIMNKCMKLQEMMAQ